MVILCDENILGKKYEEGKIILDLSQSFYTDSTEADKKEIMENLKHADQATFIGEEAIKMAMEIGIIKKSNILIIENIPYVMVVVVPENEQMRP